MFDIELDSLDADRLLTHVVEVRALAQRAPPGRMRCASMPDSTAPPTPSVCSETPNRRKCAGPGLSASWATRSRPWTFSRKLALLPADAPMTRARPSSS